MEIDTSDDESDGDMTEDKHEVKIGHVLNPSTGRWCKMTGRVFNRMVNEKLGSGQRMAGKQSHDRIVEPTKSQFSQEIDIWKAHGF